MSDIILGIKVTEPNPPAALTPSFKFSQFILNLFLASALPINQAPNKQLKRVDFPTLVSPTKKIDLDMIFSSLRSPANIQQKMSSGNVYGSIRIISIMKVDLSQQFNSYYTKYKYQIILVKIRVMEYQHPLKRPQEGFNLTPFLKECLSKKNIALNEELSNGLNKISQIRNNSISKFPKTRQEMLKISQYIQSFAKNCKLASILVDFFSDNPITKQFSWNDSFKKDCKVSQPNYKFQLACWCYNLGLLLLTKSSQDCLSGTITKLDEGIKCSKKGYLLFQELRQKFVHNVPELKKFSQMNEEHLKLLELTCKTIFLKAKAGRILVQHIKSQKSDMIMQYICYQLLTELGQFCKAYMKKNTPLPGALKKAFLDFIMIQKYYHHILYLNEIGIYYQNQARISEKSREWIHYKKNALKLIQLIDEDEDLLRILTNKIHQDKCSRLKELEGQILHLLETEGVVISEIRQNCYEELDILPIHKKLESDLQFRRNELEQEITQTDFHYAFKDEEVELQNIFNKYLMNKEQRIVAEQINSFISMKIKSVEEIKKKLIDKMKRELKSRNINYYIGLSHAHNKNKELHPQIKKIIGNFKQLGGEKAIQHQIKYLFVHQNKLQMKAKFIQDNLQLCKEECGNDHRFQVFLNHIKRHKEKLQSVKNNCSKLQKIRLSFYQYFQYARMKKSDLAEELPKIQKAGLVESQYEDIKKLQTKLQSTEEQLNKTFDILDNMKIILQTQQNNRQMVIYFVQKYGKSVQQNNFNLFFQDKFEWLINLFEKFHKQAKIYEQSLKELFIIADKIKSFKIDDKKVQKQFEEHLNNFRGIVMMFEKILKGKHFLDQTQGKLQRFEDRIKAFSTDLSRQRNKQFEYRQYEYESELLNFQLDEESIQLLEISYSQENYPSLNTSRVSAFQLNAQTSITDMLFAILKSKPDFETNLLNGEKIYQQRYN